MLFSKQSQKFLIVFYFVTALITFAQQDNFIGNYTMSNGKTFHLYSSKPLYLGTPKSLYLYWDNEYNYKLFSHVSSLKNGYVIYRKDKILLSFKDITLKMGEITFDKGYEPMDFRRTK